MPWNESVLALFFSISTYIQMKAGKDESQLPSSKSNP